MFVSRVLRSVTWRALLITQALAALFAVVPWLEQSGSPNQPRLLFSVLNEGMTAMFVMLAAFAADDCVRRGWTVLRAFATALLGACAATALTQLRPDNLWGVLDTIFGAGAYWGVPMLVYLNRQSAARLLANVQAGELRRVQAQRALVESDLAAAQAQINPAALMQQLARVRDLHAASDPAADHELELLIADLRRHRRALHPDRVAVSAPTAVIAEDEPLIRQEIRDLLAELWPPLTILAEVGDGVAALASIERHAPDVVFLDIQMPGLNGLEVAQRLSRRAHVVFVTAFDKYAVAAFEQGALDYVLKPISTARMQVAVERLRARLTESARRSRPHRRAAEGDRPGGIEIPEVADRATTARSCAWSQSRKCPICAPIASTPRWSRRAIRSC